MRIFMSISIPPDIDEILKNEQSNKLYILTSYEYRNALRGYKPSNFKDFIADSGAFTAMNAGKKIDGDYIDKYIEWIKRDNIDNFIEMDLDEIIGYEKTIQIRKKIEKETGKPVIPCWHLERGEDGWKRMCDEYDYVAISLSRLTKTSKWLQKYNFKPLSFFLSEARKRRCKVHALGCNDLNLLRKYHFYSADSSTHTLGRRFGQVLSFDGEKVININKARNKKIDPKKANGQNIKTMIEVMRYAETNL